MNTRELSTCFVTKQVDACRDFYQRYLSAKAIFDCGWYLNLCIGGDGPSLQLMHLEDHPWGDRGFSIIDPIGTSLNIYSDREPSYEFKPY